ncbi:MAG: 16S rRNA (cytidine(1402)-2'-O)-methyltransferase [Clostridia bacterium]|nr:16S rRNA (cytidine(1402)-2'-O)-methyltransferase [Clostridia bacterium]
MSKLYVVATPIGNLNDMSKRGIETLENVDLILAEDTRHTLKLLNSFDIKTRMEAYHKFNEKKKSNEIIEKMKENEMDIAIVTDAGTPCISDPGFELVKEAHENGIEVLGVPGCSAVINALSISGFDTLSFSFVGFIPRENKELKEFYSMIEKNETYSIVCYESPKRIIKSLNTMKEYLGDIELAVMSDMTKLFERTYRGTISEVLHELEENNNADKGEYAIALNNKSFHKEAEVVIGNAQTIEGMIIDEMTKTGMNMKDAIKAVSEKNKISKSEVYDASLNLKKMFEK